MNQAISEIEQISENTRLTFSVLTPEQINWKPTADGWSVGQCFEHLILTNDQMLELFGKVADGTHQNSFMENWSPLTSFFGGFLIKSLKSDAKKFKAPSKTIVPPSNIAADIIEQFVENNRQVNEVLHRMEGVDMKKTVLTSPFMSLMTYNLADGITILVEHERRHFRQAERVLQTAGFPQ